MQNKNPITRFGIRVLRPGECKQLLNGVTKPEMKTQFQALLFTGMRYVEMKRFWQHPSWFDGDFINLPKSAVKKQKRTQMERAVRLNAQGKVHIEYFTRLKRPLPSWQSWTMNLKRWAKHVDLDTTGLSAKTTRKTWESWLMYYFPERRFEIALSQGHTTVTSLRHYLNMPFTELDRYEVKEFVEGW